jgi:ribonucleoside-diphosphate reductase alpha chain
MHTMADAEAIGRLVSISLQATHPSRRMEVAKKIGESLQGIGGSFHIGFGKNRVMSMADAVGKVLSEDISLSEGAKGTDDVVEQEPLQLASSTQESLNLPETSESGNNSLAAGKSGDLCSECGNATLIMEEGCMKCYSCGYSKC